MFEPSNNLISYIYYYMAVLEMFFPFIKEMLIIIIINNYTDKN